VEEDFFFSSRKLVFFFDGIATKVVTRLCCYQNLYTVFLSKVDGINEIPPFITTTIQTL
jgi:hypothetical protein